MSTLIIKDIPRNQEMNSNDMGKGQAAFLLAQLGAHAASQFAERLGVLELAPPDAGILRLLRIAAGLSQQELASKLQIHPSRLVAILDNLEKRGFVGVSPPRALARGSMYDGG